MRWHLEYSYSLKHLLQIVMNLRSKIAYKAANNLKISFFFRFEYQVLLFEGKSRHQ